MPDDIPLQGAHWIFAVETYCKPKVAESCLELQDSRSVDITVLLIAAFAAVKHRHHLTLPEIRQLDSAIFSWRHEVTQPLRAVRRRLKVPARDGTGEVRKELRDEVKRLELRSEQISLAVLAEKLEEIKRLRRTSPAAPADLPGVLGMVIKFYRESYGSNATVSNEERREQELAQIIAAAATS